MRLVVLVAALSVWMPSHAHALCVAPAEHFVALNAGAAVPVEGGLLIATELGGAATAPLPDRDAWKATVDGALVDAAPIALAPGLDLVRFPASAQALSVADRPGALGAVTRATQAPPALAAPKVVSIVHATWPSRRGNSSNVTVTPAAIPADAVALIIADAKTGKPRSFGRITPGEQVLTVYAQGRCSALPNGTRPTVGGDRVVVRWVDRFGRLSPASKVFKVPPTTVQK